MWRESVVTWADRWDLYLTEDHLIPLQVHWYSIISSIFLLVFCLSCFLVCNISKIKRDVKTRSGTYVSIQETEEEEEAEVLQNTSEELSWKAIHEDIFRPPKTYPLAFCVFVANGVQLGCAVLVIICLSALGIINPARRGSFINQGVIVYIMFGRLAGYTSSRLLKSMGLSETPSQRQKCTFWTAGLVPVAFSSVFLPLNVLFTFLGSTASVSVVTWIILLFGLLIILNGCAVYAGTKDGYKLDPLQFSQGVASSPRVIPDSSSSWRHPLFASFVGGGILFSIIYMELFFIMISLWMFQYYYVFWFTLAVFMLTILTATQVSCMAVYCQLNRENHRWWWLAFWCPASTAIFMFLWSITFFQALEPVKGEWMIYFIYFGYTALVCFGASLITGAAGVLYSLFFVNKLYQVDFGEPSLELTG
jgi:transmembrane 9 superfamily protein 2/4